MKAEKDKTKLELEDQKIRSQKIVELVILTLSFIEKNLATISLISLRSENEQRILQYQSPIFKSVVIYLVALPYNFRRGHYLPGGGGLLPILQPIYLSGSLFTPRSFPTILAEVTYMPSKINCLVLSCFKALIHIRLFSFCHDLANI